MSCSDPDCPACKIKQVIQELHDSSKGNTRATIGIVMMALGEVVEAEFIVGEELPVAPHTGTVH